eukprot:scaffold41744_cov62-Phaeocystis_antarctica.AAC.6
MPTKQQTAPMPTTASQEGLARAPCFGCGSPGECGASGASPPPPCTGAVGVVPAPPGATATTSASRKARICSAVTRQHPPMPSAPG